MGKVRHTGSGNNKLIAKKKHRRYCVHWPLRQLSKGKEKAKHNSNLLGNYYASEVYVRQSHVI